MSDRSDWFRDSIFHLHYDHHVNPDQDPPACTAADADQIRRLLEKVRPDSVAYHAKGHPGWTTYPTDIGFVLPSIEGEPRQDLLRLYRDITRELGIKLIVALSGLVDHQAADNYPSWARVDTNGIAYHDSRRSLCPNQDYVDTQLLPMIEEIIERYEPDGFWLDGENWSVRSCHCERCVGQYSEQTGQDAPYSEYDERWRQWLRFHRDSFIAYLDKVGAFIHEKAPNCLYASNAAYTSSQPERPTQEIDRLSWDLSPAFGARQASLEARLLASRGQPFDLMTWNLCSARPWASPPIPTYPKTAPHLLQEGAVIMANGGRWTVGINPNSDDRLPEAQHDAVAQAAEFARERQACCQGAAPVPCIAVLHGASSHYAEGGGNGLYDSGKALDRLRGAHQALLELHLPFEILNETVLQRRLREFDLVILPEQVALDGDLANALREYVSGGGGLLATGPVAGIEANEGDDYGASDSFLLEDVLGVRPVGDIDGRGYILQEGQPLRVGASVWRVDLTGAREVAPLLRTNHTELHEPIGHPAVTEHEFSSGKAVYCAAEIFTAYHRHQYPGLRDFIGSLIERLLPELLLRTNAPPTVEVVYRQRAGQRIVHLVNHDPGRALYGNAAFIEKVPSVGPLEVILRLPSKPLRVLIAPAPGAREAHWTWEGETAAIQAPEFNIHTALIVEMQEEADDLISLG